ncbi:MAG TPA: TlpA disulfide reductase family protein [Sediminibacterium sp.]
MKKLLIILLMPVLAMAQGGQGFTMMQPQVSAGFVIKGNLSGLKDSTEITLKGGDEGKIIAKGIAKKGSFTLKGKLTEPDIFQLSFAGYQQFVDLFISNDAITISGDLNQPGSIQVKGSPTETEYEAFKATFNPFFQEMRTKVQEINGEKEPAKRDSMIQAYTALRNNVMNAAMKFVKEKPASPVSTLTLFAVMPLFESPIELEKVYTQLQPSARKGALSREIEKKISDAKIGMIGSQALDFTQKDVDGKPVSLASFRGKYVLVDFWASWCKPCRMENPNVVEAYQNYKDKNFTVLGVSLDQSKNNWLQAIQADKLSWTHVSDLQYWNNAVAQLYRIQSIPANLLVDPNGKIIARDIRGEELQRKLKELLK